MMRLNARFIEAVDHGIFFTFRDRIKAHYVSTLDQNKLRSLPSKSDGAKIEALLDSDLGIGFAHQQPT
jgi:hypothetical protein